MIEQRTGYVIVSNDPAHPGVVLFMVDRSKQTKSFWSNTLEDVFVYQDKSAAEEKASSLSHNNPRSVNWDEARAALRNNMSLAG